jgi:hypothetical protein
MAIDLLSETLISLTDAARSLPFRRGGKRPHVSCIYRWTTTGCRGVILESSQVGGTRCTSREAIARFIERLTAKQTGGATAPTTSAQRERAIAAAERELRDAGV